MSYDWLDEILGRRSNDHTLYVLCCKVCWRHITLKLGDKPPDYPADCPRCGAVGLVLPVSMVDGRDEPGEIHGVAVHDTVELSFAMKEKNTPHSAGMPVEEP